MILWYVLLGITYSGRGGGLQWNWEPREGVLVPPRDALKRSLFDRSRCCALCSCTRLMAGSASTLSRVVASIFPSKKHLYCCSFSQVSSLTVGISYFTCFCDWTRPSRNLFLKTNAICLELCFLTNKTDCHHERSENMFQLFSCSRCVNFYCRVNKGIEEV